MADRPNVLLICTDHWPGQMIGALGHPVVRTLTLDQIAANGVSFTNAYATTPICVPARRELMTGTFSPTHGDRFQGSLAMPDLPTVAQTFRDAGYQAYAVGKLHVNPARDRIGFDDVVLHEEGHNKDSSTADVDDYEIWLGEQVNAAMKKPHLYQGVEYRPWPLPEYTHPTNWVAREMAKQIVRRDPKRPAFWYMSFTAPHPLFQPLEGYMNIYRNTHIPMPFVGDWAKDFDQLPYALKTRPKQHRDVAASEDMTRSSRQAFYALSTHVDHEIRSVVGTLKDEGLADNTIIVFTSDHGDMLGNHDLWIKWLFYEGSTKIPMLMAGTAASKDRLGFNRLDDRLVAQADVMPTLLELCDIPVPDSVEGRSILGDRREYLYGEIHEDDRATRMVHDGRHKLIYYAVGSRTQLFDLKTDPDEMQDRSDDPSFEQVRKRLTGLLIENLYGSDLKWLQDGKLVGLPDKEHTPEYRADYGAWRGYRFG